MINNVCLFSRNVSKIPGLKNHTNSITQAKYYEIIKDQKLELDPCNIEDELNKVHAKTIQKASG